MPLEARGLTDWPSDNDDARLQTSTPATGTLPHRSDGGSERHRGEPKPNSRVSGVEDADMDCSGRSEPRTIRID